MFKIYAEVIFIAIALFEIYSCIGYLCCRVLKLRVNWCKVTVFGFLVIQAVFELISVPFKLFHGKSNILFMIFLVGVFSLLFFSIGRIVRDRRDILRILRRHLTRSM